MKVLNLYAGIGGNRKLWTDVDVTAVEIDSQRTEIYKDYFPNDTIVVGDAHDYLLKNYANFDFIWSSPPCPTHSQLGRLRVLSDSKITGAYMSEAKYPDMGLYQEILLLKHFFKGKWCVENVIGYYEPLIKPSEFGGHYFWHNFHISLIKTESRGMGANDTTRETLTKRKGYNWDDLEGLDRELVLRNCVEPEVGLHILKESQTNIHQELFN